MPLSKRNAWIQIIVSGFIGTLIYVGINAYLSDDYTVTEGLIQGALFLVFWLIVQAFLNRRRFKALEK